MVDLILGIVGTILYPLFSVIFVAVDAMQAIFRSFAGVGGATVRNSSLGFSSSTQITAGNSGETNDTGLVFYLLNTPLVQNMLVSIFTLAIFLMIVFTVMAFIKNTYSAKPKTWQDIIGSALKGIINFVFIPVCCLLGIWLGNILLKAIDGATSNGGATRMSRKLFIASAYNANIYRTGNGDLDELKTVIEKSGLIGQTIIIGNTKYTISTDETTLNKIHENKAVAADLIDSIYASGEIGITWYGDVNGVYELHNINYLILVVGGVFMLYVLVSLAYGMIRRLFIILMLFIISPALCAMYPLDDGKATGSLKSDFFKQTISAYGAVAGMNLMFSLLPLIENISILGGTGDSSLDTGMKVGGAVVDNLVQILIIISALFVVKEFISMISGYIGAEDAYSKGASLRSSTKGALKKHAPGVIKGGVKRGAAFVSSLNKARKSVFGYTTKETRAKIGEDGKEVLDENGKPVMETVKVKHKGDGVWKGLGNLAWGATGSLITGADNVKGGWDNTKTGIKKTADNLFNENLGLKPEDIKDELDNISGRSMQSVKDKAKKAFKDDKQTALPDVDAGHSRELAEYFNRGNAVGMSDEDVVKHLVKKGKINEGNYADVIQNLASGREQIKEDAKQKAKAGAGGTGGGSGAGGTGGGSGSGGGGGLSDKAEKALEEINEKMTQLIGHGLADAARTAQSYASRGMKTADDINSLGGSSAANLIGNRIAQELQKLSDVLAQKEGMERSRELTAEENDKFKARIDEITTKLEKLGLQAEKTKEKLEKQAKAAEASAEATKKATDATNNANSTGGTGGGATGGKK